MLPTPTSSSSYGSNQGGAAGRTGKVRHNLEKTATLAGLLPTPVAREWRAIGPADYTRKTPSLAAAAPTIGVGGTFIALREWMMGWPLGWSASEPLETDRFQQWLRSHGVCSAPPSEVRMSEPRVFSASAIELADDRVPERGGCRRAWAHRYIDGLRKAEMTWEQVLEWEAWAKDHGYWSEPAANAGIVKPVAGQRSASLGTRTHLYAQWYVTGAATADADVYGPRRLIDWESLPGQVLQSMLPLLPPAGSVARELAEISFELEVDGVKLRGLIDLLLDEVWDHKTTRDIRTYALLPDVVAHAIGAPERSLKSNLQACIYALHRAKSTDATADAKTEGVTCRWTYGETDRTRRALQVVQDIPVQHALQVVQGAADFARQLAEYETSDAAPPNTLACDKYGGCWYRGQPCKVRRDYGRIALLLEKDETEMAEKKMSFAELRKATQAAKEGAEAPKAETPAPAAPAAAKPKFTPKKVAPTAPEPEPAAEPEETEAPAEEPVEDNAPVECTDSTDELEALRAQVKEYAGRVLVLEARFAALRKALV
jgi:hypothetical protein